MSKFAHLSENLSVGVDKSYPYLFGDLLTQPTAHFKPATEDNRQYAAALIALGQKRRRKQNKKPTLAEVQRERDENIDLVASHCITGWDEKMADTQGKPVPFTQDDGRAFLESIPHWVFDGLFFWLQNPANFTTEAFDYGVGNDGGEALGKPLASPSSGKSDTKKTDTA